MPSLYGGSLHNVFTIPLKSHLTLLDKIYYDKKAYPICLLAEHLKVCRTGKKTTFKHSFLPLSFIISPCTV